MPYFHVVFTLFMQAASQTLLTLAHDDKRLGATPAITMVLHTWTGELVFHPHVHAGATVARMVGVELELGAPEADGCTLGNESAWAGGARYAN